MIIYYDYKKEVFIYANGRNYTTFISNRKNNCIELFRTWNA